MKFNLNYIVEGRRRYNRERPPGTPLSVPYNKDGHIDEQAAFDQLDPSDHAELRQLIEKEKHDRLVH